jgi:hypothetical protein
MASPLMAVEIGEGAVLSFCLGAFDLQSTKMCEIMKVTNGRLIIGECRQGSFRGMWH